MKSLGFKFINIVFLAFLLFITACVGSVKNKNATQSNVISDGGKDLTLNFTGLVKVNPIAHNKVELFFFPASGIQSDIMYQIYINGSPISSKISGSSLSISSGGMMSTTVTNLTIDTTYTFNMKATSTGIGVSSILDPAKALSATTFANETADFLGISSLSLVPGLAGENSVTATWNIPTPKSSSASSPRATDVVTYEIKWISNIGRISNLNNNLYVGADKGVMLIRGSPDGTIPSTNSATISNLRSGTTYYFQVRAIHKNYSIYSTSDKNYKYEMNTKYLAVTTLNSSGIFFFSDKISVSNPSGKDFNNTTLPFNALSKLNVSWLTAAGPFYDYRVCHKKFTPTEPFFPLTDIYDDMLKDDSVSGINNIDNTNINNNSICQSVPADKSYLTLTSLDPYSRYQIKVVACKNQACDNGNRKFSELALGKVMPSISPFGGITRFQNPIDTDVTSLNSIKFFFDPPDSKAGFVNKYKLYCYDGASDPSPVPLKTDNTHTATTYNLKKICSNITVASTFPTSAAIDDFDSFNEVQLTFPNPSPVDLDDPINGIKEYCLSLVPTIDSSPILAGDATQSQEARDNFPPKCFTPKIETPTIIQFPGRNEACTPSGSDLQIVWPKPTGALHQGFIVFWQEKTTDGLLFDFRAATDAYKAGPTNIDPTCVGTTTGKNGYCWIEVPKIGLENYDYYLKELIPGTKYNIAVLPYLVNGTKLLWAQYNYNVGDCSLPLPSAKFDEWEQIFAVGPKEDGLTPPSDIDKHKTFFLEKMQSDDIPVEVTNLTALTSVFDGIYGKENNLVTNPNMQYSNSGIVQLRWKDVWLFSEANPLYYYINKYDLANISDAKKTSRKYGYKVYRSDDNKLSWTELTSYNTVKNPNQTLANSGLVQPKANTFLKISSQATPDNYKLATFTDYSVVSSSNNGDIDRARVFFYKIVPVFNGKELTYDSAPFTGQVLGNPNHNIIKVVLPPRNMALVNRLISNRSSCYEMNKTIRKGANEFYSCDYNGLGATSLTQPMSTADGTVLDQGGDLLIDRFELGLPFTRGHPAVANSNSQPKVTATKVDFDGRANNTNKFKGCFNSVTSDPNNNIGGLPQPSSTYSYHNLMPGDCMSDDVSYDVIGADTSCSNPADFATGKRTLMYPGTAGDGTTVCELDHKYSGSYLADLSHADSPIYSINPIIEAPTQSEFAAVFYNRTTNFNGDSVPLNNFPAGNGKFLADSDFARISLGFFNLPYFNNAGKMFPRWIATNRIFGNMKVNGTPISFWNMTLNDIITSNVLYDSTNVKAPAANSDLLNSSRYDINTTPIARIITSNAAKLPPAQGFGWKDSNLVCSTYKIQVGYETSSNTYHQLVGGSAGLSKRLLRRKEFVSSAAWPTSWNGTKVKSIEGNENDGSYFPDVKSCQGNSKISRYSLNGPIALQKNSPLYTDPITSNNYFAKSNGSSPNITGSSGTSSTEACVSRYGIQDMAGNLREFNSDALFCTMMSSLGVQKPERHIQNGGNFPNAIDPLNTTSASDILYDTSYSYDPTNVHALVHGTTTSGECSTTFPGSANNAAAFIDPGPELVPVVKPGLAASYTNLISAIFNKLPPLTLNSVVDDPLSMLTTRDGMGHYLDFSDNGFLGQLKTSGAITYPSGYFNSILGLQLTCNGSSDCANAIDNTRAVASSYNGTQTASALVTIPIYNATFSNSGVEEIGSVIAHSTDQPSLFGYNYVKGIIDSPLDFSIQSVAPLAVSANPGGLYNFYWNVSRDDPMRFSSGGSYNQAPSRYSVLIDGSNRTDDRSARDIGVRCGILIEE